MLNVNYYDQATSNALLCNLEWETIKHAFFFCSEAQRLCFASCWAGEPSCSWYFLHSADIEAAQVLLSILYCIWPHLNMMFFKDALWSITRMLYRIIGLKALCHGLIVVLSWSSLLSGLSQLINFDASVAVSGTQCLADRYSFWGGLRQWLKHVFPVACLFGIGSL